jgi:hypothetical protein
MIVIIIITIYHYHPSCLTIPVVTKTGFFGIGKLPRPPASRRTSRWALCHSSLASGRGGFHGLMVVKYGGFLWRYPPVK